MPPKAKAKAVVRAKAKAVLRRPAAVPAHVGGAPARRRRGLRRPAGADGEGGDLWSAGSEVPLHTIPLDRLHPKSSLVLTEADYCGAPVVAAGKIQKVEVDHHGPHLYLRLTGTTNENLLRMHTQQPDQVFRVHLCPEGCGKVECGELYLHGTRGRRGQDQDEPWTTNLVEAAAGGEDELAALRARGAGQAPLGVEPGHLQAPGGVSHSPDRKKESKKKKKKKAKTREEKVASGRLPSKAVQKEASQLFSGTALDPKERVRTRVMKSARRFASRKKAKGSSSSTDSGSSSSSSSSSHGLATGEGVFSEETKTQALGERYPGALTMETLMLMRRNLLATAGEDGEELTTKPVALLYFRSVLGRKCSGAQARELLNISCAIDALLRARPAQALDILCQRLKAQESVLSGTNWAVAQRIELASQDTTTLIPRAELQSAQRESYLESRARWQASTGQGGKGAPKGKGKDKSEQNARDEKKGEPRRDKGKGGDKK